MPIVPVGSLPLFAFANDGSMAWLRASGSRLLAVDPKTGVVLREVRLDPAPFGIAWHVERHGDVFVVRDDREIAAYEGDSGMRLWRRTWPTKVAILGERDGRRISVAPGPAGVDVVLANLETGAFEPRLRVEGTMDHVGAHGVVAGDMLFFATDQREAWAIALDGFRVAERHALYGSHVLPPVATARGVHVAVIEARAGGDVTKVTTLDRATGALVRTDELPGRAHSLAAGASGLVLDFTRSEWGPTERVAFRPDAPQLRLVAATRVEMNVLSQGAAAPRVEILGPRPAARPGDELVPAAGPPREDRRPAHDALSALLVELGAESVVLSRVAEALARRADLTALAEVGVHFRDPRVRWSVRPARDPCLVEIARLGSGDALATYLYPPARGSRAPAVRVSASDASARWLADDVDAWLAHHLHEARASAPDRVAVALAELGLERDFPRPLSISAPPRWFFEAHATSFRTADADLALAAGDALGAERMLVSAARTGAAAEAKPRLLTVYEMLGWSHHRALVAETW